MARLISGGFVCLLMVSCGESTPPPSPSPDLLVLELGGGNSSLQKALRKTEPAPEAPPPAPVPQARPEAQKQEPAAPQPAQVDPPPAQPPAERWVVLQAGQTPYGLARDHLGSGARWREILEINGWTEEAQARRLATGTRVRLPER